MAGREEILCLPYFFAKKIAASEETAFQFEDLNQVAAFAADFPFRFADADTSPKRLSDGLIIS